MMKRKISAVIYSKLRLRTPLHSLLAAEAKKRDVSLNSVMLHFIERGLERETVSNELMTELETRTVKRLERTVDAFGYVLNALFEHDLHHALDDREREAMKDRLAGIDSAAALEAVRRLDEVASDTEVNKPTKTGKRSA